MPSPNGAARPLAPQDSALLFASLARYRSLLLAVSGGADSMALLHLAAEWRRAQAAAPVPAAVPEITVATVDHRLRPGSSAEAAWVGAAARVLGLPHETLVWEAGQPGAALQERARAARYALLGACARRLPPPAAIVTAHHREDQVETFLMRLARGSGLDGLAAMPFEPGPARGEAAPALERPLLDVPRGRLVATLAARRISWIEDPSNVDVAFERVRLRKKWGALADLGLGEARIVLSVRRLQRARRALDLITRDTFGAAVTLNEGAYAAIRRDMFLASPEDVRIRLLRRVLVRYGGGSRPPRLSRIERLAAVLAAPGPGPEGEDGPKAGTGGASLGGCLVSWDARRILVFREPGRTGLPALPLSPGTSIVWDGRFVVCAAAESEPAVLVRALGGDGLARLRRETDALPSLPYRAAVTLPSFWAGEKLLAVPHLGFARGGRPETYMVRFL